MKKSVSNRIRKTKTGKLIRRAMGMSHFKAKKSGKQNRQKRRMLHVNSTDWRALRRYSQITFAL